MVIYKGDTISLPDLRKLARGAQCKVNTPFCNYDSDTVVLAHKPKGAGMGIKSPDLLGAHCCSACHDVIDGRNNKMDSDSAYIYWLVGVMRTIESYYEYRVLEDPKRRKNRGMR